MNFRKKIHQILLTILALLLVPGLSTAQTWQLVWSDEFDSETLDMDKWSFQIGTGPLYGLINWGNNELQYYTDREENIFIEDGKLHIVARQERFQGRDYTSARIRSINKGDWTYGKFEIRAKTPKGRGLWPAIWMMPTESVYGVWPQSGEIDIMELVGHLPHRVHGTVHYGPTWPNNLERGGVFTRSEGDFSDDFHVYSIIWQPNRIRWFVDGQLYFLVNPNNLAPHPWPFDQDFHMLLNVAVGGTWPGNPDSTTEFPQEMVIDYVRVYQDQELVSIDDEDEIPGNFDLHQNYPNPFNPDTNISFDLREFSHVTIEVFDIMGRKVATVADRSYDAGTHTVRFDARGLGSGTYIYRMSTGSFQKFRSMQLIK
ncbi:MAG: glycosyl hydrolase family protein [Balneolaceae bacterium]|nr:MAG: glycosyl hydrolase family protein [Balneolaceae bacterium]